MTRYTIKLMWQQNRYTSSCNCRTCFLIHFFPKFSHDASDSPFAHALNAEGISYRFFSSKVSFKYQNRLWLILVGWPTLLAVAMRSAARSLLFSDPYPDTVVLDSHIEVVVFGLLRKIMRRKKPLIVLTGFIYTSRRNPLTNRLRYLYFRTVFRFVSIVICHSTREASDYSDLFSESGARFVFVPYGLHVDNREQYLSEWSEALEGNATNILTAGRSARDYRTLFNAVRGLPVSLHVVCDNNNALEGLPDIENVTILKNCYDRAYLDELKWADLVVIPLAGVDISAGQMVMVQAMALGKPVIITRTPTVEDYVTEEADALLYDPGNVEDLRRCILRLVEETELRKKLSETALRTYEEKYSMRVFVHNLISQIRRPANETPQAA